MSGSMGFLAVTKPKEKSAEATQNNSTSEKQACLGYSYQSHKKQTEHNDQPDWVSR
jgi:hypothetical protein